MKKVFAVFIGLMMVIVLKAENYPYKRVTLCVANHPALSDMAAAAEEGRTPVNEHWTSETTNRQQLDWILKHIK